MRVREYSVTLGDHPCADSFPLTLDWEHTQAREVDLDRYEKRRRGADTGGYDDDDIGDGSWFPNGEEDVEEDETKDDREMVVRDLDEEEEEEEGGGCSRGSWPCPLTSMERRVRLSQVGGIHPAELARLEQLREEKAEREQFERFYYDDFESDDESDSDGEEEAGNGNGNDDYGYFYNCGAAGGGSDAAANGSEDAQSPQLSYSWRGVEVPVETAAPDSAGGDENAAADSATPMPSSKSLWGGDDLDSGAAANSQDTGGALVPSPMLKEPRSVSMEDFDWEQHQQSQQQGGDGDEDDVTPRGAVSQEAV